MDFGALPPEINSARMYSGAGVAPMLGAASAWSELAGELHTAAECYHSVITGLATLSWSGPASMQMASAAARYVSWMTETAAQVERTAAQVNALAGAYQIAFAGTVPPPQIAVNRSLLATLVATNILGVNSPAIAATEAQYAEMWAQDAAVMYGYADSSSAASMLTPFNTPPQTTDQTGAARQQAATTTAAASAQQSSSTGVASAVQQTLQNLSSAPSSTETWQDLQSYLPQIVKNLTTTEQIVQRLASTPANILGLAKSLMPAAAAAAAVAAPTAQAGVPGLAGVGGAMGGPIAAIGRGGTLGGLSIPPSWASLAGTESPAALSLPAHGVGLPPGDGSGMLRGLPMSGVGRRSQAFVTKYGVRHRVIPRTPALG